MITKLISHLDLFILSLIYYHDKYKEQGHEMVKDCWLERVDDQISGH